MNAKNLARNSTSSSRNAARKELLDMIRAKGHKRKRRGRTSNKEAAADRMEKKEKGPSEGKTRGTRTNPQQWMRKFEQFKQMLLAGTSTHSDIKKAGLKSYVPLAPATL